MKMLLIILLATLISINAQDRLDPEAYLDEIAITSGRMTDTVKAFKKGWNWENETRKLDSALKINFNHYSHRQWILPKNKAKFINNMNFLPHIQPIVNSDKSYSITMAQAIQYEPVLDCSMEEFETIQGDSTGAVFGFKYRQQDFLNDQDMYHNFVFRKSVLDSIGQNEALVLSDVTSKQDLFDDSTQPHSPAVILPLGNGV